MSDFNYKHTHVSRQDGSPAMQIPGHPFTLTNEDGFIWQADERDWLEIGSPVANRIAELKEAFREATGDEPDDYQMGEEDWAFGLGTDDAAELVALLEGGSE